MLVVRHTSIIIRESIIVEECDRDTRCGNRRGPDTGVGWRAMMNRRQVLVPGWKTIVEGAQA